MKILEGKDLPHVFAQPIRHFEAAVSDAREMITLMKEMSGEGRERNIFALHHSQVNPRPLNFFVLNFMLLPRKVGNKELFASSVICNARIIGTDVPKEILKQNEITDYKEQAKIPMSEGCASFPNRTPKYVPRYEWVKVAFEVPDEKDMTKFHKQELDLPGIYAQIFQHEIDHANGKNIYFDKPKTI